MNYLFFDIECATCRGGKGKICEFGYLLTDENFNILNSGEFFINPKSGFDWYTTQKILHFPKSHYINSPDFSAVYSQIKDILCADGQLVLGQATKNDMKFLKDECQRYSLPYIDVLYGDVGYVFKVMGNLDEVRSLDKMCEMLGVEVPEGLHRAMVDAGVTMEILKSMCAKYNLKADELFSLKNDFVCKFDFTEKTKKERKKIAKKKPKAIV